MATSYAEKYSQYLNVGPLIFQHQLNGYTIPEGVSGEGLVQNYPFTDMDYEIMDNMTLNESAVTFAVDEDEYLDLKPSTTQAMSTGVSGMDLFMDTSCGIYLKTLVDASNETQNRVPTCSYVRYCQSRWSEDPAVSNVNLDGFDLLNVPRVSFDESANVVLQESSGSFLTLTSNGLMLDAISETFELNSQSQAQILFDISGIIQFYAGDYNSDIGQWERAATPAATITTGNNFQASLEFNSPSFVDASMVTGTITWKTSYATFPSIMTLPPLVINSTAQLNASGEIDEILFSGDSGTPIPTSGAVLYAVIVNNLSQAIQIVNPVAGVYCAQTTLTFGANTSALVTFVCTNNGTTNAIYMSIQGMNAPGSG
jgi:hypothetical protein